MRHKVALLALAGVGATAMMLGWGLYRNSRISSRYEAVTVGASDQQVVRLLRTPSWVEACGKSFGRPKSNCAEYIYRNSSAPLLTRIPVSFDTGGHVVDKYVYSSTRPRDCPDSETNVENRPLHK